jgi:hypothetical protein
MKKVIILLFVLALVSCDFDGQAIDVPPSDFEGQAINVPPSEFEG